MVVGSGFVAAHAAAVLVDPRETSLDHPNAGPDVETLPLFFSRRRGLALRSYDQGCALLGLWWADEARHAGDDTSGRW